MDKIKAKELLFELLSVPSVNGVNNEKDIASFICDYLIKHKIDAKLSEIDDMHANVYAYIKGEDSSRTIMWNGHMDTVEYGNLEEWDYRPEIPTVEGTRVYARGSSDMKSGLAAMLYTLAYMRENNIKPRYNLMFLATCDEERGGLGAYSFIKENDMREVSHILVGEPTALDIALAQKGCIWLEIRVYGKTSHGAYPKQGVNAIEKAFEIFAKIKEKIEKSKSDILGNSTVQLNKIEGGFAANMTADFAKMLLDIRLSTSFSKEDISKIINEALKEMQVQAEYEFLNYRPNISLAENDGFCTALGECIGKRKESPKYCGINYFTDASVFLQANPDMKILLFGPGEPKLCHKPNEYADIEKYYKAIDILSDFFSKSF